MDIRDRIKELRRVPASTLVPNPRNWRTHPERQANALRGLLAEVGIAAPVIARELPDGRLQLIDGHLRIETLKDEMVPVAVLDVTEAEADKLLATMDPLSALAGKDDEMLVALIDRFDTDNPELQKMLADLVPMSALEKLAPEPVTIPEKYEVLCECRDEAEQRRVLELLQREGVNCRSLIS